MLDSLSPAVRSGRQAAWVALEQYRSDDLWVTDSLPQIFDRAVLPSQDRALATDIVRGCLRHQTCIDTCLGHLISRPRDRVEPELWTIMQLGIYQLVWMDGVPAHAAIHETVELARQVGRAGWPGFVNGVLRGMQRLLTGEQTEQPASQALPKSDGNYALLTEPLFPDPASHPVGYLTLAFSTPEWMAQRYVERFTPARCWQLGFWNQARPLLWLRANTLRSTAQKLLEQLQQAGLPVELVNDAVLPVRGSPTESDYPLRTTPQGRIEEWPGYAQGEFVVQDWTSMRAAITLAPQPGENIWDVCAAPGGKACHLATLMGNTGQILATDSNSARLALVDDNARRLGLTCIRTAQLPADGSWVPAGPFDAVLLDAPCSNTGVLSRRAEARWRLSPDDVEDLADLQWLLLRRAAPSTRPGGRLLYSVCSLEPEEGPELIQIWLEEHPNWQLQSETSFFPGEPSDGGYQALLIRHS